MSISAFSGPVVTFGAGSSSDYNPEQGPSLFLNGMGILDPRQAYTYQNGQGFGSPTCGWLGTNRITTLYAPPMTIVANLIVASAHIVAATPLTLASANASGLAVGVSITRADTGVLVTGLLEIDPLVTTSTCSIASGSNVLTVTAMGTGTGYHPIGLTIGAVLTDASTAANIPAGTKIVAYGTGNGGLGTYIMSANATATAASDTVTSLNTSFPHAIPMGSSGTIRMYNPFAMLSRALILTSTTSQVDANAFVINGFDVYGYPMTETITTSGTSATTTAGKKAFKYIQSITPTATDGTGNYTVGTSAIIGFPIRTDRWQAAMEADVSIMSNNAAIAANTGYVAAVSTKATATTGDVRGTFALQTAADGTLLVGFTQNPFNANLQSSAGIFGVPQFASF